MRTRRKGLLQLLGLLRVIEGEGVEVARAPKLELGAELATGRLRGDLLDARGYVVVLRLDYTPRQDVNILLASLRLAYSMNCLMSVISFG